MDLVFMVMPFQSSSYTISMLFGFTSFSSIWKYFRNADLISGCDTLSLCISHIPFRILLSKYMRF